MSDLGQDEQAGVDYLHDLFEQVPVQDSSARAALQTFTSGKGDAMLAYENEAILARQAGQAVEYTIPDETIVIQNPVAVTETSKHPRQAKAFLQFLYSKRAQEIFADNGYRPIVPGVVSADKFATPPGLVSDLLGGPVADVERRHDEGPGHGGSVRCLVWPDLSTTSSPTATDADNSDPLTHYRFVGWWVRRSAAGRGRG